jgi:hypothetical protein
MYSKYMTLSFVVNNAKLFIIVTGNVKGNVGMITKQHVLPCKALITMKGYADLEFFATHLTPGQQNKLVQIIGRKCIVLGEIR